VEALDDNQRIEEIARMSAGAQLTPESLAHAEQLLKSA
jgi:DNA repair ATPase RecN